MAALHYVPNRGAQQLAGKRTRTLGLMTSDLALHAPSQIASAVKSRAVEQGASVLISMVEQPAQCQAALQELLAQRVEALLVNVPLEDAWQKCFRKWPRRPRFFFSMCPPQLGLTVSFSMPNRALPRGQSICFRWGTSELRCSPGRKVLSLPGLVWRDGKPRWLRPTWRRLRWRRATGARLRAMRKGISSGGRAAAGGDPRR